MNLDLLISLFTNLALVAVLFIFAKWFIGYDMRWWVRCQRANTISNSYKKWVYLQIKLPKDVFKTPAAMETVLWTLNQGLGHRAMPTIPQVKYGGFFRSNPKKSLGFSFHLNPIDFHDNGKKKVKMWEWIKELKTNFFLKYQSGSRLAVAIGLAMSEFDKADT
jgi:hypothetical protein